MAAWNPKANEIFLALLEFTTPDERRAYLDQHCGGDATLRDEVEALLTADEQAGDFLKDPSTKSKNPVETVDFRPLTPGGSRLVGPYKLLQKIGEGGFGVVYMAEQEKPIRRMVALKIIKPGMDTDQVIARFESERQALALMDHPNIAKVLDAGTTGEPGESGRSTTSLDARPYFVMELVKGVPITEFCDKNHMPADGRLKLFIDVCHAIQHAHHKGVIHRDIKPSNVLVTLHDGVPVVKVIDFGVSKATVQKLTEKTLFTAFGQMIGTPAYMSPEQAEMSGLDIDTRSDVYSLSVLLYELLTGTTPLETQRLREAGYVEIQRLIREEEAPRPSTRLSSMKDAATVVAGNRGLDPKRLAQLLAGDLDWVVMKALDKERARRYDSPGNFAADIERYLKHEAIVARPPSTAYKLKKFTQRNRGAALTVAAVAFALLLGTAAATWQAFRAWNAENAALLALNKTLKAQKAEADERKRAEANEKIAKEQRDKAKARFRMARDAVDQYFTQVSENPDLKAKGLEGLRTDLLESAAKFYEKFVQEEGVDPDLQLERGLAELRLSQLYLETSKYKDAEKRAGDAKVIFARLVERSPSEPRYRRELARSEARLGLIYQDTSRRSDFIEATHRAIDIQKRLVADYPNDPQYQADLCESYNDLGTQGYEERAFAWKESLKLARKLVANHPEVPMYRNLLVTILSNCGYEKAPFSNAEAISFYNEALPIARQLTIEVPGKVEFIQTLQDLTSNLGVASLNLNKPDDAQRFLEESRDAIRQLATEHPLVIDFKDKWIFAQMNLGETYRAAKRWDLAESTLKEGLTLAEQRLQSRPNDCEIVGLKGQILTKLARLYRDKDQRAEAEASWRESIALQKSAAKLDHGRNWPQINAAYADLIEFYRKSDQEALAEAALKDILHLGFDLCEAHPNEKLARSMLITAVRRIDVDAKGGDQREPLFREIQARVAKIASAVPKEPEFPSIVAHASRELGEFDKAILAYQQALKISKEQFGVADERSVGIARNLSETYTEAGKHAEAEQILKDLAVVLRGQGTEGESTLSSLLANLGLAMLKAGKPDEAERVAREVLSIRERIEPTRWTTSNTRSLLGAALLGQKKYKEAEPLLLSGYEGLKRLESEIPPAAKSRIPQAIERLARFYDETGTPEEAAKWRSKLEEAKPEEPEKK